MEKQSKIRFHYLKKYLMLLSLCVLFGSTNVFAQKALQKGNVFYDKNLFLEAIPYFIDASKEGTPAEKDEALMKLANSYRLSGQFSEAEDTYKKIFQRKKKDPENLLNYAHSLKSSSKYEEAANEYREYKKLNPTDKMADIYVQSCIQAQRWLDEDLTIEVKNFNAINSSNPDFAPVYYQNGLVFCSARENSTKKLVRMDGGVDEAKLDLYYEDLRLPFEELGKPLNVKELNTWMHEGPATLSADEKEIYITRTVEGKKNKETNTIVSTLQVFYSKKGDEGKWSEPVSAFSFNSNDYSVGHPCLSQDGNRIYFMSDMPGGLGGTDIYYSEKIAGEWSKPVNLGPNVNTFGHELFPYLLNNNTIYFSSDTHPGMGKLDIFSSTFSNGKWGNSENMKTPINSIGDDYAIAFDRKSENKRGFFSSDRFNGNGLDDIYSFIDIAPISITVSGGTIQLADQKLYDGIKYKLINDETQEEQELIPVNNLISFQIPQDKNYTLVARKDGFGYNKIHLRMKRNTDTEFLNLVVRPELKAIKLYGVLYDKSQTETEEMPVRAAEVALKDTTSLIKKVFTNQKGFFDFGQNLLANNEYTIVVKKWAIRKNAFVCRGTVTTEGKAMSNVLLKLYKDLKLVDETRANEKGEYKFNMQANVEDYTIVASSDGFKNNFAEISTAEIHEGDNIKQDIEMERMGEVKLTGIVKSKEKNIILPGVQIIISKNKRVMEKIKTEANGKFIFNLIPDQNYSIVVTKQGFFQKEVEVSTFGKKTFDNINIDVLLDSIQLDKTVQMKNIYYDYNKAEIRYESLPELDKLIVFLLLNPSVTIELSSYTDSRGDDTYNLQLSQQRAENVGTYLCFEGISKNRILTKGYGETRPVFASAATEEQHQENRRTEFKVLKK